VKIPQSRLAVGSDEMEPKRLLLIQPTMRLGHLVRNAAIVVDAAVQVALAVVAGRRDPGAVRALENIAPPSPSR
jgi:hypothetical protein